ncbi:MAG: MATE family efflux transporter [Akkermansiaceae bacterium]|nr:MATE family efflux transporter [Akkermansiaceae bacterium]
MSSIVREGRATTILALPLMAGQVSQMLMGVVDTYMIGKIGTVELAAATLAHSILHLPLMLGIGVAIAVSIKVSQGRGAKDKAMAKSALRDGFLLSLVLGVATLILSFVAIPLMPLLQQDPEVVERLPVFFILVSLSMTPAIVSMAVRNHSDGMAKPWPVFWIIFAGVWLNVFLNWLLIYGNWGAPEMGLEGAGLATLLARLASMIGVMGWCRYSPDLRDWSPHRWFLKPQRKELADFWNIAWPASLQVSAEMSAFIVAAFLIGSLGAAALAAHTVAIMCVGTTFMVPLGISMALTVQIGEAKGAKTFERMRPIVVSGWLMGLMVSLLFVGVFLVFDEALAASFLTDEGPMGIVVGLLWIAAIFQIADHSQILSSGVLRGMDDVKKPALITFMAHWLIGMPFGIYLTFWQGMGVAGIWWGLSTGLIASAVLLGWRAWRMTSGRVGLDQ